jgi:glycosyltransferase involved in cell wall biosynthesis
LPAILHLIDTGGPGGAENVFLRLLAEVQLPGCTPVAVVGRDGWLAAQVRSLHIEPLFFASRGSFQIGYLRSLVDLIRKRDVRLIVAHLYGAAIYGNLAGRLCGVPVVAILHGQSDIARKERLAWAKARIIGHLSSRIVFVSEALREDVVRRLKLPRNKTHVIENGIDLNRPRQGSDGTLRESLGLPPGTFLIGAVGNVRATKGYATLLRAARLCVDAMPSVRFVIAGDTNGSTYPPLARLRSELGLEQHVHFLGLRSDVPKVLANFDLYVLSSDTEGFSIALVEAMAAGLPAVATRSGGPETILEDGRTGVLVPPGDPQAMANALLRLANDAALRAKLAHAARESVARRYGAETMIENYHNLLRPLAAS